MSCSFKVLTTVLSLRSRKQKGLHTGTTSSWKTAVVRGISAIAVNRRLNVERWRIWGSDTTTNPSDRVIIIKVLVIITSKYHILLQ